MDDSTTPHITIGGRQIGHGCPVYMIAEMSANHGQDYEAAVQLVHAAANAGADAIKLQTYTPDTITIDCDSEHFRIEEGLLWEGRKLYELYGEAYTPWEWQPKLKTLAEELGMDCFSSPFDATAVDFLEELGVPAHKIASFELVDIPLLRRVAATGKPIIMSTGMATLEEIDEAVRTLRDAGCEQLALLKCTSGYPAAPDEMDLRTIPHLSETFDVPAGLSDHTLGIAVPVAAVALGACIVEKHFTLCCKMEGPDHRASIEPDKLKELIRTIRDVEAALGSGVKCPMPSELPNKKALQKSLVARREIRAGETIRKSDLTCKRPCKGLPPSWMNKVIGRKAKKNISENDFITLASIKWE